MAVSEMIEALIRSLDGRGIHELMRANEIEAGRGIVLPGDVAWLPVEDWHPTVVVSLDRREVRLVAILALNPGHGAFRRCVAAIKDAGLKPVVIEPTAELRATLTRWGWAQRIVGSGFEDREEQWRPRK